MSLDDKEKGQKIWAFEIDNITKAIRDLKQNVIQLTNFVLPNILQKTYTDITINNTTTETDILSVPISANLMETNNMIRFKIYFQDSVLDTGTITVKLKLGGTTLATITAFIVGASSMGYIEGFIYNNNSNGAQIAKIFSNSTYVSTGSVKVASDEGTGTKDTTTTLDLSVTLQFNTVSASNIFYMKDSYVEFLKY